MVHFIIISPLMRPAFYWLTLLCFKIPSVAVIFQIFVQLQQRHGRPLIPTATTVTCMCLTTVSFRVVLGWAYRGLTGGFLLLQNFSVAISVSPHVCFILVLILIFMFLR